MSLITPAIHGTKRGAVLCSARNLSENLSRWFTFCERERQAGKQARGWVGGRQASRGEAGRQAGRVGGRQAGRQAGRVSRRQASKQAGGGKEAGRQAGVGVGGKQSGKVGGRRADRGVGGWQTRVHVRRQSFHHVASRASSTK